MEEADLCELMFLMVAAEPGASLHRLAKDMGISLMSAIRIAHLLAEDGGAMEGPALIALEKPRDGKSLLERARLTAAGEALAASALQNIQGEAPWPNSTN